MRNFKNFFIFKITVILFIAILLTGFILLTGCSTVLSKKEPIPITSEIENTTSGETENTSATSDTSEGIEIDYVTADWLNAKLNESEEIIILDVRSEDSFMEKHIKNAVNIPYVELEGRIGELDNTKKIVIYCSDYDCGLSTNAVTMLIKAGFKNVSALVGGIEGWQEKAYPVE